MRTRPVFWSLKRVLLLVLLCLAAGQPSGVSHAQVLLQNVTDAMVEQKDLGWKPVSPSQYLEQKEGHGAQSDLPLFAPAAALSHQDDLKKETPLPTDASTTSLALAADQDDETTLEEIEQPVSYLKTAIEALEKDVEVAKTNDEALSRQRVEIDALISGADLFLESLQPRYQTLQDQIARLGPPPTKEQSPETPAVTAERARIAALSAVIDGAIKSTGLIQYRSKELLSHVQDLRTRLFTNALFLRHSSPFSMSSFREVFKTLPSSQDTLWWTFWRWQRTAQDNFIFLIGLLCSALFLYIGLSFLRKKVFSHRLDNKRILPPPFFHRAGVAGWVALLLALPSSIALIFLFYGLDQLGLWFLDKEPLIYSILPPMLTFIGVRSLALAIFQPSRPQWRLINLENVSAGALSSTLGMIGFIYAIDTILKETIRILALPLSVSIAVATLSSIALATLFFKIVFTRFAPQQQSFYEEDTFINELSASPREDQSTPYFREAVSRLSPYYLKVPLIILAVIILGATLSGYVALGRFIAQQVIVSGSLIILVILLQIALRVLFNRHARPEGFLGGLIYGRLGLDHIKSQTLSRVTNVVLGTLLIICVLPLILFTWGFELIDTLAWIKSAIVGFEIGHFHISPIKIVIALGVLGSLLFVTRLAQGWFLRGFVTNGRIDSGIANSLHKAIGYCGFALAVVAAMSYAGVDITNFALVAGALSVGIGFGLQSIVNNFVSGLILLIERPLKVGDLIVVNGQSGRVRNIAVRSTEIETADRSTLIVPNSELISSSLTNWTHRNSFARVHIEVTSSYQSLPEYVCKVLEKVASDCPLILQNPKPEASFEKFGSNGFEFCLTATVSDVSKRGSAQSDLRHRIVKAFKENGIEMPHPQYDVHLRDLDFIKMLLSRAAPQARPYPSEDKNRENEDSSTVSSMAAAGNI